VLDAGRTKAAVSEARARADAARAGLADLEQRIRLEVTQRRLDVGTARAAVRVCTENVGSAEENRRVSQERYRAGVSPSSELLDAETALLRANLSRTNALAQLRIADASLRRAVGK
jgi:outer membrane protein TolC